MTEEGPVARDSRTMWIIVLAVVITVLLGVIIGYIASGGLSGEPTTELAPATTAQPVTPTSAPPAVTTTAGSVTTSQPVASDPPGQLTILASEDTYSDASDPEEINGFDALIELEDDPPEVKQSLVRFEVAGIPEGVAIEEAILRIHTTAPSSSPIAVHLVNGDWNETETGAANAPAVGDRVATIPPGGDQGEPLEGDVTGTVTGPGSVSFYLLSTTENTTEIFSRENGANGPALILRWTP